MGAGSQQPWSAGRQGEDPIPLEVGAALGLIAPGARVHTFTTGFGLMGCNIDREDLAARVARSKGRWICDYIGLGHELLIDDAGVALFIECDAGQVLAVRPNRTRNMVAQGCEARKLRDGGGAG